MLATFRQRRQDDEGFTLIELMVVVLIIAILIAIAIPTFLGAQNRARDRGAQSNLRNSMTAAKTVATDHAGKFLNDSNTVILAADMGAAEPALANRYSDTTADTDHIEVITGTAGADITLVTESASNKFFGISATSDGLVSYCSSSTAASDCEDPTANYSTTPW